jgi:uncharacterized SAM-binding protein YcdF (DUF218 family)
VANQAMNRKGKWFCGAIALSALVAVILVFSFKETILIEAGNFMAPEANSTEGVADVVILEGSEFISKGTVSKGLELLSSGKAKRMAIVLHNIGKNHWPFAFHEDYPSSVRRELQKLGLKDSDFIVIVTPIQNPVTLTSARGALKTLAKDGVKKAILVSPGFHMRRSYLIYQHLSVPLDIKIYPIACFDKYPRNNWWKEDTGPREFVGELQKLIYYMAMGYIPLKLSY